MTQLVTGEAVGLDLNLAALPSRALARAVDGVIQLVGLFVLSLLAGLATRNSSPAASAAVTVLLLVLVVVGYPVAWEALTRGRTPGKMVMGLRVVRDDGGPIAFRQAFVRGLTTLVDLLTSFVVSIVCMLLSPRSKRLGDLVAGTVVVQERVAVRGGRVATMPPQLAGWARGLELSGLSDELALSVRQFVAREDTLTPQSREQLGQRLVAAVNRVIAPAPPPGTPGWALLNAVLAERRERELRKLSARPAWSGPGPSPGRGATPLPGARAAQPSWVPPPVHGPAPSYAPPPAAAPATGHRDGFAVPF